MNDQQPQQPHPRHGVRIGNGLLGPVIIPADIAPGSCAENAYNKAIDYRYRYGMAGLVVGVIAQVAGVVMLAAGFATPEPWSIEVGILGIRVSSIYPGLLLMALGPLWAWITRFDVTPECNSGGGTNPPPGGDRPPGPTGTPCNPGSTS